MTTTTKNLADALRALVPLVPFDGNHDDEIRKGKPLQAARAALAAYDADVSAGMGAALDSPTQEQWVIKNALTEFATYDAGAATASLTSNRALAYCWPSEDAARAALQAFSAMLPAYTLSIAPLDSLNNKEPQA